MKALFGAACGLTLACLAAMPSDASTVTLDVLGMPNSANASAQLDGVEVEPRGMHQFATGSFLMQNTTTFEQFVAWCIEVAESIDFDPTTYETNGARLAPERETLISRLFTGYLGDTTTNTGAAAFQLAIWEIVEETSFDIAGLNVSEGYFRAGSSDIVIETANNFLMGLNNFDANYRVNYFRSANSQDVISASPVPLPASILFLGAGLGALVLSRRGRTAKSVNA